MSLNQTDTPRFPCISPAKAFIAAMLAGLFALAAANLSLAKEGDLGPQVGQAAQDFELAALGGGQVKLSERTKTGPVVLVVLRGYPGYQCPACSVQFQELVRKADDFQQAHTQVLFVYPGPSEKLTERAAEFVRGKDYPDHFQILLDPDYKFTTAYGLRWDAKNETAYPATYVIDKQGKIRFATVSKTHGGRAKSGDVVKALPKE